MLLDGKQNRRSEVGERFAHAGPSFNDQVSLFFQGARHRHRHRLLLGTKFEILCRSIFTALSGLFPSGSSSISATIFRLSSTSISACFLPRGITQHRSRKSSLFSCQFPFCSRSCLLWGACRVRTKLCR